MIDGRRPRVGLVLGSGGIKCAAAIGLIRALEREGIPVDLAVGSSGGSLYATAIALGMNSDEILRGSEQVLQPKNFARRNRRSLLAAVLPRLFDNRRFGVVDDSRLNETLASVLAGRSFSDCTIPLHVVTTDLNSADKVVITSGDLFDAVRASIAIPFALRPWPVEGRMLCDGGVCDPLPVDVAVREGCDVILAMGFENPVTQPVESAMGLALQTSTIAVNQLLRRTLAFLSLAHHAEIIPIMPVFERPLGLGEAAQLPWIVAQGEAAAEREIPYLKRLLARQGETTVVQ